MASKKYKQHRKRKKGQPGREKGPVGEAWAPLTTARPLAPEDIAPRDYLTALHVVAELPSFLWCGDGEPGTSQNRHEPVRIRLLPQSAGVPLQVISVCLPFVLVRNPRGERFSLDVRQCQLARLDEHYAKSAWRAFASRPKK